MPTVAEQLRQAREKSGKTINEVSEITKIKTDHLRALEEGNYEVFSAPVYIRGFIRTYSNLLKLDTVQLLAELDEEMGKTGRFKEHPRFNPQSKNFVDFLMLQLSKVNWTVALPLIVVAIILLAAVFGYRFWKEQQSIDPLKGLGPGLYEGSTNRHSGEKLRVPMPVR
ncbi:MAG: helix-turn-helix domain-containing protein [Verrucomicrobiales bacterium]